MAVSYDLFKDLENANLKRDDMVLIHSSVKSIGYDVYDIIDTLLEYFNLGTVIVPTHTWSNVKYDGDCFDVRNTPSCVGLLTNKFMEYEGVRRTMHPTHSVAVWGKYQAELLAGEELVDTPCSPNGVYAKLPKYNAKVLLIGVNNVKNTYIHAIEEIYDVQNRVNPNLNEYKMIDYDGNESFRKIHRHYCSLHDHVSETYPKLDRAFYVLDVQHDASFGNAAMMVVDTVKALDVLGFILNKQKQLLVEEVIVPEYLYSDYNKF